MLWRVFHKTLKSPCLLANIGSRTAKDSNVNSRKHSFVLLATALTLIVNGEEVHGEAWVSRGTTPLIVQYTEANAVVSIYREIGPGQRIALSKLAVETYEKKGRPLRLAIDVSIWLFQIQSGQGRQSDRVSESKLTRT